MANNTKKIRIVIGDVEFNITAPVAKIETMTDLLMELGAYAICPGYFKLTEQQYFEFSSRSSTFLY